MLVGIALLGLGAIWILGGSGRSTQRLDSELVPQLGSEPSEADGLSGADGPGREASGPGKSVTLAPDPRHAAEDPRFTGAPGELRGHIEITGEGSFPEEWSLVLRPSKTLYGRELAEERTVEFTDGSQDFHVRNLALAGYDVHAEAEGMNASPLPVMIDKRNHSPFVNLRMSPAGFLEGLVVDASGILADDFPLTLVQVEGGKTIESRTDALGRYRFEGVLDGAYQLVLGSPSSPIVPEKQSLRFQAPSMILPDIELPPLATLTLQLVDQQRRLLPDGTIKGSGNQGGHIEGTSDAYGYLTTRYLPAGRYRIRVELEGFLSKRVTLELMEGESKEIPLQMLPDA